MLHSEEDIGSNIARCAVKLGGAAAAARHSDLILYTEQGIRVLDTDELIENENLYLESSGGEFVPRTHTTASSSAQNSREGSRGRVDEATLDMRYIGDPEKRIILTIFFKCIVVGSLSVGKSCILLQFTDQRFAANNHSTIGVDFGARIVPAEGTRVKLQIWDTAGQEDFKAITRAYYREAAAALVVYDKTNYQSFLDVASWLSTVREGTTNHELVVTLVGNKSDLCGEDGKDAAVSTELGERFARENACLFIETSARTGRGVEEAFRNTADAVMRKVRSGVVDPLNPCQGVRVNVLKAEERRISGSFGSYGGDFEFYYDPARRGSRISLTSVAKDRGDNRNRSSSSGRKKKGGCC